MMITYEPLTIENINEAINLQRLWAHEDITYGLVCDDTELFDYVNEYSFVAQCDGNVIGYITANITHDNEYNIFPRGSDYLVVNDLFVKKEYRSNKIGCALLSLSEAAANKNGIMNIFLSSATKDSEAIRRFYTDNGYHIWTTMFYKRTAPDVRTYDTGFLMYYKFVVIYARYNGKWVFTRHRERTTWECAGGHIEIGETTLEAAKRELYEETGAEEFTIYPVCDYSVHNLKDFSNGQVFLAEITKLGEIPDPEMEEIKLLDTMPEEQTYPHILPVLFREIEKVYEKNS